MNKRKTAVDSKPVRKPRKNKLVHILVLTSVGSGGVFSPDPEEIRAISHNKGLLERMGKRALAKGKGRSVNKGKLGRVFKYAILTRRLLK